MTPKSSHRVEADIGRFDSLDRRLRAILRATLKSRERKEIVYELQKRGYPVSLQALKEWCADSKDRRRLPALLVRGLVELTNDPRLALFILPPRHQNLLRLADAELRRHRAQRRLQRRRGKRGPR